MCRMCDGVLFTADDDVAEWRVSRLRDAFHYALGRLHKYESDQESLAEMMLGMHDHEGTLTVMWKAAPWALLKAAIKEAWYGPCGDGCDNVEHVLRLRKVPT